MFVVHCKFNHVGFGIIYSIRNLVFRNYCLAIATMLVSSMPLSPHAWSGGTFHRLDFFDFVAF